MKKINLAEKFALIQDQWRPRIVAELNGQHIRLAKIQGDFDWHAHEDEDECFLIVAGSMRLELRDDVVELGQGEIFVVPAGVEHRPSADEECQVLLFEPANTVNTGSSKTETEITIDVRGRRLRARVVRMPFYKRPRS